MTSSNTVLSLHGVQVSFGTREVLRGVDLAVGPGEVVAVMGRSGSGKSTLLSVCMGLLRPDRGTVMLNGHDLTAASRQELARLRGEQIGAVFQGAELLNELTAVENVEVPVMLRKAPRGPRAHQLLERLDVAPGTLARDLSGGERMRVAIARSLVNEPSLILADEPTGSLDTELRSEAAQLLFDHVEKQGCAMLLVTHDPGLASQADRTLTLHSGVLRGAHPAGVGSSRLP